MCRQSGHNLYRMEEQHVQRELAGTVRFTSSDLMANAILASCLGPFQKLNPGVRVELTADALRSGRPLV